MKNGIPEFLLGKSLYRDMPMSGKASRASFLDTSLNHFAAFVKTTYVQWESAHKKGLLQQLDSRVKLLFLLLFIVLISVKSTFLPGGGHRLCDSCPCRPVRLNLVTFYSKIFLLGLVFGFLVVIPSSVNVVSGGDVIALSHPSFKALSVLDLSYTRNGGDYGTGTRRSPAHHP